MKKFIISALALATPFAAMAAATTAGTAIQNIIGDIKIILNAVIPVFMLAGTAVFLWGIIKYITAAGDEEKAKTAKSYIIYGLIGVLVMVTFWGIITVLANAFNVTVGGTIIVPSLNL